MDGVLCDINMVQLNQIAESNDEEVEKYYYQERKPLLNPYLFMTAKDKFIVVTARKKHLEKITKDWLNKFLPGTKWFLVNLGDDLAKRIAEQKLEILKKENVEVYIDDSKEVIDQLRDLSKSIKFIQYGGRI